MLLPPTGRLPSPPKTVRTHPTPPILPLRVSLTVTYAVLSFYVALKLISRWVKLFRTGLKRARHPRIDVQLCTVPGAAMGLFLQIPRLTMGEVVLALTVPLDGRVSCRSLWQWWICLPARLCPSLLCRKLRSLL